MSACRQPCVDVRENESDARAPVPAARASAGAATGSTRATARPSRTAREGQRERDAPGVLWRPDKKRDAFTTTPFPGGRWRVVVPVCQRARGSAVARSRQPGYLGTSPGPWLCGPASRRVCLCQICECFVAITIATSTSHGLSRSGNRQIVRTWGTAFRASAIPARQSCET